MKDLILNEKSLLEFVTMASRNRRKLKKAAGTAYGGSGHPVHRSGVTAQAMIVPGDARLLHLLRILHGSLSRYMTGIEDHLRSSPVRRHLTDRELLATREQYYLYMIEFELVNRLHVRDFMNAAYRIALLPYCLKESHAGCKAIPDELDYRCSGCLRTCYVHRLSRLLENAGIQPYILSRGRIGNLLKVLHSRHGRIGVLGAACVVELIMGMRLCRKAGFPVIGIPLNANRCPRWMGNMHDTNIDLAALENLIGQAGIPVVS